MGEEALPPPYSTKIKVPAPIRDFAVNSSCRNTKASISVITTLKFYFNSAIPKESLHFNPLQSGFIANLSGVQYKSIMPDSGSLNRDYWHACPNDFRPLGAMDRPEPLLGRYGMKDWLNQPYKDTNPPGHQVPPQGHVRGLILVDALS